jgi:hypothetical protein
MESNFKSFVVPVISLLIVGTAAVLLGNYLYAQMNRVKTLPPATTTIEETN